MLCHVFSVSKIIHRDLKLHSFSCLNSYGSALTEVNDSSLNLERVPNFGDTEREPFKSWHTVVSFIGTNKVFHKLQVYHQSGFPISSCLTPIVLLWNIQITNK